MTEKNFVSQEQLEKKIEQWKSWKSNTANAKRLLEMWLVDDSLSDSERNAIADILSESFDDYKDDFNGNFLISRVGLIVGEWKRGQNSTQVQKFFPLVSEKFHKFPLEFRELLLNGYAGLMLKKYRGFSITDSEKENVKKFYRSLFDFLIDKKNAKDSPEPIPAVKYFKYFTPTYFPGCKSLIDIELSVFLEYVKEFLDFNENEWSSFFLGDTLGYMKIYKNIAGRIFSYRSENLSDLPGETVAELLQILKQLDKTVFKNIGLMLKTKVVSQPAEFILQTNDKAESRILGDIMDLTKDLVTYCSRWFLGFFSDSDSEPKKTDRNFFEELIRFIEDACEDNSTVLFKVLDGAFSLLPATADFSGTMDFKNHYNIKKRYFSISFLEKYLEKISNFPDLDFIVRNTGRYIEILREKSFIDSLKNQHSELSEKILEDFKNGCKDLEDIQKAGVDSFKLSLSELLNSNNFVKCYNRILTEGDLYDISRFTYILTASNIDSKEKLVQPLVDKTVETALKNTDKVLKILAESPDKTSMPKDILKQEDPCLQVSLPLILFSEYIPEKEQKKLAEKFLESARKITPQKIKNNFWIKDRTGLFLCLFTMSKGLTKDAVDILANNFDIVKSVADYENGQTLWTKVFNSLLRCLDELENGFTSETMTRDDISDYMSGETGYIRDFLFAKEFLRNRELINKDRFKEAIQNNISIDVFDKCVKNGVNNNKRLSFPDYIIDTYWLLYSKCNMDKDNISTTMFKKLENWKDFTLKSAANMMNLEQAADFLNDMGDIKDGLKFSREIVSSGNKEIQPLEDCFKEIAKTKTGDEITESKRKLAFLLFMLSLQNNLPDADKKRVLISLFRYRKHVLNRFLENFTRKNSQELDIMPFIHSVFMMSKKSTSIEIEPGHAKVVLTSMSNYLLSDTKHEPETLKIFSRFLNGPAKSMLKIPEANKNADYKEIEENFFSLFKTRLAVQNNKTDNSAFKENNKLSTEQDFEVDIL